MAGACVGRVAIVTGASRGIGAAIAARLATEGCSIAVSARTLDPQQGRVGSLRELVRHIEQAGGHAVAIRADLSQSDERERLVAETIERLGPVDILVNNAAVTWQFPVVDFPQKRFDVMFDVQVRAPFALSQLVLPGMRERRSGWILNVSSRAGRHPEGPPFDGALDGFTVYGMCKAALERFTTGLASEVFADGIAVNALAPWDIVPTPGATAHDFFADYATEGPEWMAEAAVALCTAQHGRLTGRIAYSQPLLDELRRRPQALPAYATLLSTHPRPEMGDAQC